MTHPSPNLTLPTISLLVKSIVFTYIFTSKNLNINGDVIVIFIRIHIMINEMSM
jgi:hypothetical protein